MASLQNSISSLIQRYTHIFHKHHFPSSLFSTAHIYHLRATYFQKRGLRSGHWGHISPSHRILRKNKSEIKEVIDSNWAKIERLTHLIGCQENRVVWMVSKDTRIVTSFSMVKIETIIKLLLSYGFSTDSITRNQNIFCCSISKIHNRIEALLPYRKYQFSLLHVICPEVIYHKILAMLAKEMKVMGSHLSRISFLAELLNCEEEQVHQAIDSGCRPLQYYKLSRLKSLVEILVRYGISTDEIMSNLHLLLLDPLVSKYRMQQLSDAGVFGRKIMFKILVQNKVQYPIMFNYHLANILALGEHPDKFAFLQSRLQITKNQMDLLFIRAPILKSITPRRIKIILNILLDEIQLPTRTVFRNYHLLFFSAERLQKRWEVLCDFPLNEGQLVADIILPEVKFKQKYKKWIEKNKTTET